MSSNDIYTPSEVPFQLTYLYIKQHSVTGKLYFGKTTNNPETYYGSGPAWLRHIKTHGRMHVVTLWYCLFINSNECAKFASMISTMEDIMNSPNWLNAIPETGLPGGFNMLLLSEERQAEIRQNMKLASRNKKALHLKGKTYEEIYGLVKAAELKEKHSNLKKGSKNSSYGKPHSAETRQKISNKTKGLTKGKTYEERFGVEKAAQMRALRKLPRNSDNRKGGNNTLASTIKATSPVGDVYIIKGKIAQFCEDYKIELTHARNNYLRGIPHPLGWSFELLDPGIRPKKQQNSLVVIVSNERDEL